MNIISNALRFAIICLIMIVPNSIFGQDNPDIDVRPLSFSEQLPFGSSITKPLTVKNLGSGNLQWSIPTGYDTTSLINILSGYGQSTIHNFHTGPIIGDAVLTVTLNGDYDDDTEYAEVIIEGKNLGQIDDKNVSNGTDIIATYNLSSADVTNWTSDGVLAVTIKNSYDVNSGNGGTETHKVRIQIQGLSGWISLSKSSGTLGNNQTENINVTFSTINLDAGNYTEEIVIKSNDPDEAEVTIPVTLTVLGPSISVTPNQISMNLDEGSKQSTTLTISNSGEGLLKFDIQLSTQELGLMEKSGQVNNNTRIENAINSIIQRSGILEHEIRAAGIKMTTGERKETVCKSPEEIANIKYATTSTIAGLNVAVLGADDFPYLQDIQAKLLSTNKFNSVSIIEVRYTTPSLTELQAFDAVMVFKNYSYSNYTLLGNNLADYVDQAGNVVCVLFEGNISNQNSLGGRWESGQYYAIQRSSYITGNASLGVIAVPNHPIMNGVSAFVGGPYGYRPSTTNLTSGATLIASWSDGKPLVAVKKIGNVNRVDLGYYPVSNDGDDTYYGWQANTDGALLMANALIFSAGGDLPWCTVNPQSGTISANNSRQIDVTFDASTVDQGIYQGYLIIENNDLNNSKLNVPLSLTVTDNIPPGMVSNLKGESIAATFATLSWTAPGDNGSQGTAENYELRYSSQPITESNWASAISGADTLPDPASPGTKQFVRITSLTPNTSYYFALKTKDEANHYSAISNVLEVKTTKEIEGLIYLPFEEISGDEALNYQGNTKFNAKLFGFENLNGRDVATNSGWTQFGVNGGALKFDGSNDYVSITDYSGSPLHLNSGLTIQVAVKPRNDILPTGRYNFYDIITKIDNYSGYALRLNLENGRLRFLIQFGSSNVGIYESNKSTWAGGQWYGIVVTYDYFSPKDNIKIYFNGILDATYTESRLLTINDEPINIGGTYYNFSGTIDEVIIHNKAIDPTTSVESEKISIDLSQNYPNPFNPTTTIKYSIPNSEYVVIKIYNINGQEVATLLEKEQLAGNYSIIWNGKDHKGKSLPNGLYLYQIKAGEFKKTLSMSLIK